VRVNAQVRRLLYLRLVGALEAGLVRTAGTLAPTRGVADDGAAMIRDVRHRIAGLPSTRVR
jgi:hypothetical protein